MAWKIGIVLFFATVFGVNAVFVWIAVDGADPVDPTYESEAR
ncbi:MAG: hypothetical protein ACOZNI_26910 [Myxococcota bacterium]